MNINQISHTVHAVEDYCNRQCSLYALSEALNEHHETLLTLFTLTGISDINGDPNDGIQPWRVMAVITLMYLIRCNRELRSRITDHRRRWMPFSDE